MTNVDALSSYKMTNVDPLSSSADEISDFSSDSELSSELDHNNPLYVQNYVKTMETIPNTMIRDITKVKEIDSKMQKIFAEIDEIKVRMKSSKDVSSHEMKENLALVQRKLQRTLALEEIKGTCLQSLHTLVDKSNSMLDEDSSRTVQAKLIEEELPSHSPVYSNDEVLEDTSTSLYLDESSLQEELEGDKSFTSKRSSTGTRGRGRRSQVKEQAEDSESAVTDSTPNNKSINKTKKKGRKRRKADNMLEPDPDEPRYCLCDQVSYGEMIGCDNENCPIEWFHFQCVDLSCKPKGKWFCPSCSAAKKKAQ